MNRPRIEDDDLQAYVDGQLDLRRRMEVEAWLGAHPAAAARVMADLHLRDALSLELAPLARAVSAPRYRDARRLARRLRWRVLAVRLRGVASVALLLAAGWTAHQVLAEGGTSSIAAAPVVPAFADAAVDMHRAAHAGGAPSLPAFSWREVSETAVPRTTLTDAARATSLDIPDLPGEWALHAVETLPQATGTTLGALLSAPELGGAATLYAASDAHFAVHEPMLARIGDIRVAYWRYGHQLYALCAEAPAPSVLEAARRLAATLL